MKAFSTFYTVVLYCYFLLSTVSRSSDDPKVTSDTIPDDSTTLIDFPQLTIDSTRIKETIAFGDVTFGISRQAYELKMNSDTQQVGLKKYIFKPKFNAVDQLNELLIRSERASDWDTTYSSLDNLNEKIFHSYPHCDWVHEHFSYLNTSAEFIQINREWMIGTKKIITGVIEEKRDHASEDFSSIYFAVCKITSLPLKQNLGHEKDRELDSVL